MNFGYSYSRKGRMVVVHHTHLIQDIVSLLKEWDIVFFDDCLYSQYVFLKDNIDILKDMNITCVIGISPKALRQEGTDGFYAVESGKLHEKMNLEIKTRDDVISGDYINGFMCKSELIELLNNENVFPALHGCCHLKMDGTVEKYKQPVVFEKDLKDGMSILSEIGINTDIYVFPYSYEPFLSHTILKRNGFRYIFAGKDTKRIPIEELAR